MRFLMNVSRVAPFNSHVQGLALAPDDAWSVHSVAHVCEMKAEMDKGLKFMESREKDWQVQ